MPRPKAIRINIRQQHPRGVLSKNQASCNYGTARSTPLRPPDAVASRLCGMLEQKRAAGRSTRSRCPKILYPLGEREVALILAGGPEPLHMRAVILAAGWG